jgi:hypothetical protein
MLSVPVSITYTGDLIISFPFDDTPLENEKEKNV